MCYAVDTMEHKVGVRELKQQTSAVLRRVTAGEVVEVTDHGHSIARIVPLRSGVLDQLILEGRAIAPADDLLHLIEELELPAPKRRGRLSPTEALAELRVGER